MAAVAAVACGGALAGAAAAALAVSSWSVLLPVLVGALDAAPMDALLTCLALDCCGGLGVAWQYRGSLRGAWAPVLAVAGAASAIAAASAALAGVRLLQAHRGMLRGGASAMPLLFAAGFCLRFALLRARLRAPAAGSRAPLLAASAADPAREAAAAARLECPMAGAEDAALPGDQPAAHALPARRLLLGGGYVAAVAALAGLVGFGGGNAFALFFVGAMGWSTVRATCASGVISGAMALSLALVLALCADVDARSVWRHLRVAMPASLLAMYPASRAVRRMSEPAVALAVAAVFAAIFALTLAARLAGPPPA